MRGVRMSVSKTRGKVPSHVHVPKSDCVHAACLGTTVLLEHVKPIKLGNEFDTGAGIYEGKQHCPPRNCGTWRPLIHR